MTRQRLVLENLRSCHNVGSLLRSAECFGLTEVIYIGTTPYPQLEADDRLPHHIKKQTGLIHKTALGAEQLVQGSYFTTLEEYLKNSVTSSQYLIALELAESAININDFSFSNKSFDLIMGNEVDGVSSKMLQSADAVVQIPIRGAKESLNVSVAGAITMYEALKRF